MALLLLHVTIRRRCRCLVGAVAGARTNRPPGFFSSRARRWRAGGYAHGAAPLSEAELLASVVASVAAMAPAWVVVVPFEGVAEIVTVGRSREERLRAADWARSRHEDLMLEALVARDRDS